MIIESLNNSVVEHSLLDRFFVILFFSFANFRWHKSGTFYDFSSRPEIPRIVFFSETKSLYCLCYILAETCS